MQRGGLLWVHSEDPNALSLMAKEFAQYQGAKSSKYRSAWESTYICAARARKRLVIPS